MRTAVVITCPWYRRVPGVSSTAFFLYQYYMSLLVTSRWLALYAVPRLFRLASGLHCPNPALCRLNSLWQFCHKMFWFSVGHAYWKEKGIIRPPNQFSRTDLDGENMGAVTLSFHVNQLPTTQNNCRVGLLICATLHLLKWKKTKKNLREWTSDSKLKLIKVTLA